MISSSTSSRCRRCASARRAIARPTYLGCHATASDAEAWQRDPTFLFEDGVQCELCLGPGSNYVDPMVMADPEAARRAGLRMPGKDFCPICHLEKGSHVAALEVRKWEYETALVEIGHGGRGGPLPPGPGGGVPPFPKGGWSRPQRPQPRSTGPGTSAWSVAPLATRPPPGDGLTVTWIPVRGERGTGGEESGGRMDWRIAPGDAMILGSGLYRSQVVVMAIDDTQIRRIMRYAVASASTRGDGQGSELEAIHLVKYVYLAISPGPRLTAAEP